MNDLIDILKDNISLLTEETTKNLEENKEKCNKCNNIGWFWGDDKKAKRCLCKNNYDLNKLQQKEINIFGELYKDYIFDNFNCKENWQTILKNKVKGYLDIKDGKSICILGQTGIGKTHLAIALAKVLNEKGYKIKIINYIDFMRKIKQNVLDKDEYSKLMNQCYFTDYLIIDDMYKQKTEKDINYMYQIIDNRYRNKKPVIITSELFFEDIINFDEAIGGRIKQMVENNIIEIDKKTDRNYRTKGIRL